VDPDPRKSALIWLSQIQENRNCPKLQKKPFYLRRNVLTYYLLYVLYIFHDKIIVEDPGSDAFLTPRSGIRNGKNADWTQDEHARAFL
jgi:hypothetical protein